ncbi:Crp/Fnr family transcriptional regulator [candidate division CSSED10-310 bacterium]|uniref:Crp/Fnr family transcriptional regulator n=1 Tax=candidate division CSSED10-310 bacterium TaxID=2855610 RepID=A0ABV6YXV2_UNCC1
MADLGQTQDQMLSMLKNTYLFNIFSSEELVDILMMCDHETRTAGYIVFEEGDIPDRFYIIITGKVTVYQSIPGKKNVILAELQGGDFFGEMSLLDSFPRSATSKVEEDSFLLSMTFDNFNELMNQEKNVGIKWLWTFCRILSSRLRDTNEKYKQLLVNVPLDDQDLK